MEVVCQAGHPPNPGLRTVRAESAQIRWGSVKTSFPWELSLPFDVTCDPWRVRNQQSSFPLGSRAHLWSAN
jgi:hypothetical protein